MEPLRPSATEIIHDKLRLRVLPATGAIATYAGLGTGLTCDGCDGEVGHKDLEYQILLADGAVLHFHARCALVWEALGAALRTP